MCTQIQMIPPVGSQWQHKYGAVCLVEKITNRRAVESPRFPLTVCYRDRSDAEWSLPVEEFLKSFVPFK